MLGKAVVRWFTVYLRQTDGIGYGRDAGTEQNDKGRNNWKRAHCMEIYPAKGKLSQHLIYSTKFSE